MRLKAGFVVQMEIQCGALMIQCGAYGTNTAHTDPMWHNKYRQKITKLLKTISNVAPAVTNMVLCDPMRCKYANLVLERNHKNWCTYSVYY